MATVRAPQTATPLLQFCKPYPGRATNPCFGSYADLLVFAAGVGYDALKGEQPPPCPAFLEDAQPVPIPFEVFKGSNPPCSTPPLPRTESPAPAPRP